MESGEFGSRVTTIIDGLIQPIPGRDDVLRGPGQENATVATCVQMWRCGVCTWEQAMMTAVVMLAAEVKASQARLVDKLGCTPPRLLVTLMEETDAGGR